MTQFHYYTGSFVGLFKKGKDVHKGKFNFHKIQWDHIQLNDLKSCPDLKIEELKAGAFYYTRVLKSRSSKWDKITGRNTSIFIPHEQDFVYSSNLDHFLVRDIELDNRGLPKLKRVNSDLYEIKGKAYFSVPKTVSPKAIDSSNPGVGDGINTFGEISIPQKNRFGIISKLFTSFTIQQSNTIVGQDTTISQRASSGGCLMLIINMIIGALVGLLLYYLWHSNPGLFAILAILSGLWMIGKLLRKPRLSKFCGWGIVLFVVCYLRNNQTVIESDFKPQQTEDGSIKQFPPVEDTNNPDPNVKDFLNKKQLNWWDFINKSYSISYSTSSVNYRKSAVNREISIPNNIEDDKKYYSVIYERLNDFDQKFLDSFYFQILQQKNRNKLNVIQTAEMVVTMIQEIPYVLVHDMSCQKVIASSDNDFIKEYHEEKKPCLANIKAGVQSPYEFAHNLKGDCDTRALLGFSILKKLGIPTSIWISSTYGHSVLGVGLPTQGNSFKIVNNVKHYPVELTAKGFRLGMISPEHRNMNNWTISNYNN